MMNPFQWAYDSIQAVKTPRWYRVLMQELQDIIIAILVQVGKSYIEQLQSKILEVSKTGLNNKEKFRIVFSFGKALIPEIKDSALNLLIETLFNRLKNSKVV